MYQRSSATAAATAAAITNQTRNRSIVARADDGTDSLRMMSRSMVPLLAMDRNLPYLWPGVESRIPLFAEGPMRGDLRAIAVVGVGVLAMLARPVSGQGFRLEGSVVYATLS